MIYGERQKILQGHDLGAESRDMVVEVVGSVVDAYCPPEVFPEDWDVEALHAALSEILPVSSTSKSSARLTTAAMQEHGGAGPPAYDAKEETVGAKRCANPSAWCCQHHRQQVARHRSEMDYLQEGIHLRVYGRRILSRVPARSLRDVRGAMTALREEFVK